MNKFKSLILNKKILISFIVILLLGSVFGIITYGKLKNKNDTKSVSVEIIENNETIIPEVDLENTIINISETEPTTNNIKVSLTSKLEDYNLYYYINPIENSENENGEEESNSDNIEEYILYQDSIEIEVNSNIYIKYELDGKYSENPYVLEINNINNEVPENEGATEEELENEKVSNIDNTAKYYIVVNYKSNVVTIYGKDSNNEYTVPIKAMICSTGTATPRSGVYKISNRYRWRVLFGGVYGQYSVRIVGNILFHSVPYLSQDNSTLEYWEYDKLGTSASAGCVRLTVADALWIYNNCGKGTQVEFTANSSDPLGKPSAKKISSYTNLRGYDPTDPASNNPWKNANTSINKEANSINQNNNLNNNNTNTNNSNVIGNNSNNIDNTENLDNTNNIESDGENTNNNENNADLGEDLSNNI